MSNYSNYGAKARKIMLKKGITITALAQQIGISASYMSEILKGTRTGKKYISRINEILEIGV